MILAAKLFAEATAGDNEVDLHTAHSLVQM
jgi:hypothetical protein